RLVNIGGDKARSARRNSIRSDFAANSDARRRVAAFEHLADVRIVPVKDADAIRWQPLDKLVFGAGGVFEAAETLQMLRADFDLDANRWTRQVAQALDFAGNVRAHLGDEVVDRVVVGNVTVDG